MTSAFVARGSGHGLFVRDWGSGPPVLFLAGWAMDSRIWGETMLRLNAAGLRTVAYDRRGHGRSTDWGGYDYDALADDLATVIESLHLRDLTIVAHSGAGGEAMRYLARHGSERVSRLVLVGATGPRIMAAPGEQGVTPQQLDFLCARLAADLSGWIDDNIQPFAPGSPSRVNDWMAAMVMDCSRRAVVQFQRTIAEADLTADAAAIDVPVLILHGDRDASAAIDASARRYAEIIPHATLQVYAGVAHGVMVTDAARLAADIAQRIAR
ncbi:alpha/beta fold hydrolase [Altererythrobacter xixiisoli]|uniref:Alpha/beta fold hydrolase n=1 Tax=Croceibacterium xixiisoli TaxID=1476466 RepID=A0A6I4TQB2_9SPHN|nr:alpha/beta hydrolase [Croceibacterium xixiisoli]MXO98046.1 alpha/beta fold hydrolase [Croceibacterium xixiisoli]